MYRYVHRYYGSFGEQKWILSRKNLSILNEPDIGNPVVWIYASSDLVVSVFLQDPMFYNA